MKIEIDLNDILGDEFGAETIQESVKRQVIEHLSREVKEGIGKRLDSEVSAMINSELKEALKARIPGLIDDLMTTEYTPVDRWGSYERDKTTTFRKELVKSINEQMVYKKARYESDKSAFTKAVDSVVSENVNEFERSFNKLVNDTFTRETMAHAMKTLREKFGISKES